MVFQFGEDFELDEARFELRRAGRRVPVQPKVLSVLLVLVRWRTRAVLKEELLEQVWPGVHVADTSIARAIMEARKAIDDDAQTAIVTVRGKGFRFALPVVELAGGDAARNLSDPTFIGRRAVLQALQSRLRAADGGAPSVALLTGEPGMGRTRTARRFVTIARQAGALVGSVACAGVETSRLLNAWSAMFESLAAATANAQLAAIAVTLEGLAGAAVSEAPTLVANGLAECARTATTVLVFDDLHRASEESQELLSWLMRGTPAARLLCVATCPEAVIAEGRIAAPLEGLMRGADTYSLPLRGLGAEEVGALVELERGEAPSPSAIASFLRRSGGNPCYLHQLLHTRWAERTLASSAGSSDTTLDLQPGLVSSIMAHLAALSHEALRLLTTATLLGEPFEAPRLAAATNGSAAAQLPVLTELVEAKFLRSTTAGAYEFRLPLVRDVLRKRMTTQDRAETQLAIGRAFEAHYGPHREAHAAELADHFHRALPLGDPQALVSLCEVAAARFQALGEHLAAASYLSKAIEALACASGGDPRAARLHLALGECRERARDERGARAAFLDARTLARAMGDVDAYAAAVRGFDRTMSAGDSQRGGDGRERE